MDKIKELKSLKELYESGAISESELEALKSEILNVKNKNFKPVNAFVTTEGHSTQTVKSLNEDSYVKPVVRQAETLDVKSNAIDTSSAKSKLSPLLIALFSIITICIVAIAVYVMKPSESEVSEANIVSVEEVETEVVEAEVATSPEATTSEPTEELKSFEDLNNLPVSVSKFIPEGYSALNVTKGNLNKDNVDDLILVLKKNNEEETSDVNENPEKRPLLILLGQTDDSYNLAYKSDNAVYCVDCGGMMGDPFGGITIKNGYFSVEHYGGSAWRWTRIITFKYSPSDSNWYLSRDGSDSFHADNPEEVESDIKTVDDFGKVRFDEFDIYKEEV